MSRRPNPPTDRVEQNRATLKSLVKLDSNKTCADCKRNKHPRWASWNLGIFICIRCSGIHRGMGTHISRVKSVDLDSWTDEQTQNMLRWGNTRANKYWEAKLAQGHVPAEAKMENFIRTKYDSKRWAMEGGIPDPSTLTTDGDDDVPLNVVQEKAKLERSSSQRASASQALPPPRKPAQNIDLFADDPEPPPPRPNTTGPPATRNPPPKAEPAPPKQTKPGDSLLGLDFFGGSTSDPPARPSSSAAATSTSNAPSRPDLKQSILSLYASAPKSAAPPQQQHSHSGSGSFGGLQSSSQGSTPVTQQSAFGGLNDAFSGLNMTSSPPPQQQQQRPAPFSNLSGMSQRSPPAVSSAFGSGGNFFDAPKPTPPTSPPEQSKRQSHRTLSNSSGFGDFSFATPSSPQATTSPQQNQAAGTGGDLFDLSIPASQPSQPIKPSPQANVNSTFNLSNAPTQQPASQTQALPKPAQPSAPTINYSGFSNMDAWGSNDAWGAAPASNNKSSATSPPPVQSAGFGWGSTSPTKPAEPKVAADEDFGGWSSAGPTSGGGGGTQSTSKPVGGFGGDDLFSNVWE